MEKIIGMMKTYKILTTPMNLTEILLSSEIVFIVAMLIHFRSNIKYKCLKFIIVTFISSMYLTNITQYFLL